jgi:hypothetical protein
MASSGMLRRVALVRVPRFGRTCLLQLEVVAASSRRSYLADSFCSEDKDDTFLRDVGATSKTTSLFLVTERFPTGVGRDETPTVQGEEP